MRIHGRTADHPLWREMVNVTGAVTRLVPRLAAGLEEDAILATLVAAQRWIVAAIEGEGGPGALDDLRGARRELCRLGAGFAVVEMLGGITAGESVRVRTVIRLLVDLIDLEHYRTARAVARSRRGKEAAA